MERAGADAVRWALYAEHRARTNTRFFEGGAVNDAVRELLLKVWNVYSFFVTYANIDGFTPGQRAAVARAQRARSLHPRGARLHRARRAPRSRVPHPPCSAKHLQRLRRRALELVRAKQPRPLLGSGTARARTSERRSRPSTRCSSTVAKLLAPFVPFLAETSTRTSCARSTRRRRSVHLTAYPALGRHAPRRGPSRAEMQLVRDVVTLGQRVRATRSSRRVSRSARRSWWSRTTPTASELERTAR
jgi:isoleucyl-tRNA synthetase